MEAVSKDFNVTAQRSDKIKFFNTKVKKQQGTEKQKKNTKYDIY